MKLHNSIKILALLLLGVSCQKNSALIPLGKNTISTASIIGKWNVINTSTSLYGKNTIPFNRNYSGKPNDYYDFSKDGNLYLKEGQMKRTLSYRVIDNLIIFSYNNIVVDTTYILSASGKSLILSEHKNLPFGQVYDRNENLNR